MVVIRSVGIRSFIAAAMAVVVLAAAVLPAAAQSRVSGVRSKNARAERERERERERARRQQPAPKPEKVRFNEKGEQIASRAVTAEPVVKTNFELMAETEKLAGVKSTRQLLAEKGIYPEFEGPDRSRLRQNPNAPAIAEFPAISPAEKRRIAEQRAVSPTAPQTVALNFNAASVSDAGAFPPDTMGAVGPSQFVAFVNGRIRTFTKAGVADGVINADPDVFFASVMTPIGGAVVLNFTSDPNVRYDKLTGRWILTIIDVPCTNATCTTTAANRILVAVSDAASSAALSPATVWTFYSFVGDAGTNFADYPSLGVDANALYIGANMFTSAGGFLETRGYVIPKAPLLAGTAGTLWQFNALAAGGGAGAFAPRGVDNPDPANVGPTATGYFIGVDNAVFSQLAIRRVSNPSSTSTSPTISSNIALTVPTTTSPTRVPHLGNTGGTNGQLDALDDRLYAAVMRNGRLWTAHSFRVSSAGVANTATSARVGVRWYELQNLSTTPTLVQSGTVFDSAATNPRHYWIPSIAVNGQGHVAMGGSTAGANNNINAFTVGRLAGDTLGTMQYTPGTLAGYTNTSTAYNPASDPGGAGGRRWGDYSFTGVDPLDDQTIWTIQEYCDSTSSWGVRVAKLVGPTAAISAGPDTGGVYNVFANAASVNVTITGSGFFDPGPDTPGLPAKNRITASVSGANVTVNSVTYNSPTSITLNLNTVGANIADGIEVPASVRNLTITNPDGQSVTLNGAINIVVPTAANASVSGRARTADGTGVARAIVTATSSTGEVRTAVTNSFGFYRFDELESGAVYTFTIAAGKVSFEEPTRVVNLVDNVTDFDFVVRPR